MAERVGGLGVGGWSVWVEVCLTMIESVGVVAIVGDRCHRSTVAAADARCCKTQICHDTMQAVSQLPSRFASGALSFILLWFG